jgi:hypothetical protein
LALASAEFFAKTAAPKTLYISDMKYLQLIGLIACAAILISCETTQTAGMGNQERKRLAAIQQQQQEDAQMDESDRNLWNAQQDLLYTGTNPAVPYR